MTARIFTGTIQAAAPAVPAWFTALNNKQWAAPVTNTIQSVLDPLANTTNRGDAGPAAIVTAWTGAVADQNLKTIALLGNGGHRDYAGNEVYSVALNVASPAWVRRRDASVCDPKAGNENNVIARWSVDGRPSSDHTANYCVAGNGKWYKLGLGSPNWAGDGDGRYWFTFSPTTNDYTFVGSSFPADAYSLSACAVFDAANNRVIKCAPNTNGVKFYNADTLAFVGQASAYLNSSGISANIDSTNGILLVRAYAENRYYAVKLSDFSHVIVPVTGTQPSDVNIRWHWHAPSNAFITWDGAQGLLKLTPTVSGGQYTGAAWSSVAGGGGVTLPSNMTAALSGGMYSKVQLINDMGDGTAALVIVPRWSSVSDVFVMRLTGAV